MCAFDDQVSVVSEAEIRLVGNNAWRRGSGVLGLQDN